ncbi:MAG TPA: DNA-processing protein DprA [Candidatus Rubrimentiphilum sp.]|nr:DNA-processing protein DprA [Candidatus Rubrimentiphilum sp.]
MENPLWRPRPDFEALRPERSLAAIFEGLWVTGELDGLRRPTIAIVGTRAASAYGRATAKHFASELGGAGCCIISGLALGIDAAAHEGALDAKAITIGVLGGGHHHFFPKRNQQLAERMLAAGGGVLSPFPPDHPAFPSQFLQRNGVVAALADAVVVIEAPARSGALNTAGWAAGRIPVFAVPGDVDRRHVAGCHALIRDGVTLARNAQDVLDDLHLVKLPLAPLPQCAEPDNPLQAKILRILKAGETTLDELCLQSGENAAPLLSALSILELEGRIESRAGLRYAIASAGK